MGFAKSRAPRMETVYLGRECSPESRRRLGWRSLWRRLRGGEIDRKKVVNNGETACSYGRSYSNGSALARASYGPVEYSQNFDPGSGWAEPDNLSRSFSARFANPTLIHRSHLLMD